MEICDCTIPLVTMEKTVLHAHEETLLPIAMERNTHALDRKSGHCKVILSSVDAALCEPPYYPSSL